MRYLARTLVGLAWLALPFGFGCQRDEHSHFDSVGDISRDAEVARVADLAEVAALPETAELARMPDVARPTDWAEIGDAPAAPDGASADADADLAADAALPAPEFLFSFAVLADPHIDGNPAHREYLVQAVERLVAERSKHSIELVFIVGDIAWGNVDGLSNLVDAGGILDQLEEAGMHYLPVLGDNEVQGGDEQEFHEVFGAQYQYLAGVLEDWHQSPTPVNGFYLENFSFEHRGCHFVSPDFISRQSGNEAADLHDFEGGSWPWFQADIEAAAQGPAERINIFTHHGMFRTGFDGVDTYLTSEAAMDQVTEFLCPYRHDVAACYGGHIHQNWYWEVSCPSGELIYEVWITDDGFDAVVPPEPDDDRITIRVVAVSKLPDAFVYEQQVVVEQIAVE